MNTKYKNIIFDLDGTLLDTSQGIVEAVEFVLNKLNLHPLSLEQLKLFIGPPIQQSFEKAVGLSRSKAQKAAEMFRDYYKNFSLLKAKPYDSIYETFKSLNNLGIKCGVATYKREDYALEILSSFFFSDYCSVVHGADNENVLTKADIIKKCMDEMGANENDTIYVGDTISDYNASLSLGIHFIAVIYGFGFNQDTTFSESNVLGTISKPSDIFSIIEGCSPRM